MRHYGPSEPLGIDNRNGLYADLETETQIVRRIGGKRPVETNEVVRAFQNGELMIYAMRVPVDVIKIGCTSNLVRRRQWLKGDLLGFKFGDYAEERDIHHLLMDHRHHGREYYHPTPAVLAVVNEMREPFQLEPLNETNWRAA